MKIIISDHTLRIIKFTTFEMEIYVYASRSFVDIKMIK